MTAGRSPPRRSASNGPSAARRRAPVCGASVSSEQDVTPEVAEATAPPPKSGRGLSARWFGIIGLVIIGLVLFRPQGLLGRRDEMVLE